MLRWARENGCPWTAATCESAAKNEHLEVLQWARKNGCPWDEWTCSNAAYNGHFNVLQWAVENGCPCNIEAYNVNNVRPELLIWMAKNGFDRTNQNFLKT